MSVLDILDQLVVNFLSLFVEPDSLQPANEETVHDEEDAAGSVPRSLAVLFVVS